jgi:hypothetical protein
MNRRIPLALVALLLGATGQSCQSGHRRVTYVIDVTPGASGIDRQVALSQTVRADTIHALATMDLDAGLVERLQRVYGSRPDSARAATPGADTTLSYVARARFPSIPNDVGNWGTLRCYSPTWAALGSMPSASPATRIRLRVSIQP